jgi:hypothetical protein
MSEAGSDPVGFLRERLEYNIARAENRRIHNRRYAFRAKMTVTGLTIATTILIGLSQNGMFSSWSDKLSATAFMISAGTALVTTWDGFLTIGGYGYSTLTIFPSYKIF